MMPLTSTAQAKASRKADWSMGARPQLMFIITGEYPALAKTVMPGLLRKASSTSVPTVEVAAASSPESRLCWTALGSSMMGIWRTRTRGAPLK